jgi:hypothetical protein
VSPAMPLGQPDGPAWQPGRLARSGAARRRAGPSRGHTGTALRQVSAQGWMGSAAAARLRLRDSAQAGTRRDIRVTHMKNNSGSGFICLIFWLFYEAACTASSCKMLESIAHLLLLLQPNLLLQLLTRIQLIMLFLRLHKLSFLKF